jgi:hypothetical protein
MEVVHHLGDGDMGLRHRCLRCNWDCDHKIPLYLQRAIEAHGRAKASYEETMKVKMDEIRGVQAEAVRAHRK